jgi:hypothetical protein
MFINIVILSQILWSNIQRYRNGTHTKNEQTRRKEKKNKKKMITIDEKEKRERVAWRDNYIKLE